MKETKNHLEEFKQKDILEPYNNLDRNFDSAQSPK
jgi:hypothetical protein